MFYSINVLVSALLLLLRHQPSNQVWDMVMWEDREQGICEMNGFPFLHLVCMKHCQMD